MRNIRTPWKHCRYAAAAWFPYGLCITPSTFWIKYSRDHTTCRAGKKTQRYSSTEQRSKGGRERGSEGERERVGTRGLLLWINFVLINKKRKKKPSPAQKIIRTDISLPLSLPCTAFPQDPAMRKSRAPPQVDRKNPLEFTQKRKIVMWEGEKEEVYSTAEDSKGWKDTWRKIVKSLHFRPLE